MLNTAGLASDIKDLMTEFREKEEVSDTEFANKLALAIEKFVKTGTIPAGIAVSTAGTAAAQTGATTGTGTII